MIARNTILFAILVLLLGGIIYSHSPFWAICYFVFLLLLEIALYVLIHYLRKDFQWLITTRDLLPTMDMDGLAKFIEHGYDPELGWVRKPETEKEEKNRDGKSKYHINHEGSRSNPGHESWSKLISCYGDSFVFSRQVNDNETFEWHLSEMTKTNVVNFGVGNYGLDQALLRLKREYPLNRTKIVLMGVVPSTIVRILCVWKHYNEFGNVFGFKPRFKLANGNVKLVKNPIDREDKFKNYQEYLPEINSNDEFYITKFKKDMMLFPYTASIFSNPCRNLPLISMVVWERWFGKNVKNDPYPPPMKFIMKSNLRLREQLFLKKPMAVELLEKIVSEFIEYGKANEFTPVFMWMPQKDDLLHIKRKSNYYKKFIEKIRDKVITIDFTDHLIDRDDLDDLYSDDSHYGGHYSKKGNLLISEVIFNVLCSNKLIEKGESLNE